MTGHTICEPSEHYHAAKALSAGVAILLDGSCPKKAKHYSPWGPPKPVESKWVFNIGHAVHLLALEPNEWRDRITIIRARTKTGKPATNYQAEDAAYKRDQALAKGYVPLWPDELDMVKAMRDALWTHPVAKGAFADGGHMVEQSMYWTDEGTGVPCKLRTDMIPQNCALIGDIKTLDNAEPVVALRPYASRMRWHMRAAWYLDGVAAVTGQKPRAYWFLCVERKPPHCVSVVKLTEKDDADGLWWGRKQNRKCVETWARCLDRDEWPDYRDPEYPDEDRAFDIDLPAWAYRELEARDQRGAFAPRGFVNDQFETAAAMQAPLEDVT